MLQQETHLSEIRSQDVPHAYFGVNFNMYLCSYAQLTVPDYTSKTDRGLTFVSLENTTNMNIVEAFMEGEKARLHWLEKLFQNYPEFYFANDIKTNIKQTSTERNYIIKPSNFRRTIASLFICFGLFFWIMLLVLIFQNILLPVTIILLLLITSWIGSIVWIFFLNTKYSYKIDIRNDKIIIGKKPIEWERVSAYLLMKKGAGRHSVSTLVLFIDNK